MVKGLFMFAHEFYLQRRNFCETSLTFPYINHLSFKPAFLKRKKNICSSTQPIIFIWSSYRFYDWRTELSDIFSISLDFFFNDIIETTSIIRIMGVWKFCYQQWLFIHSSKMKKYFHLRKPWQTNQQRDYGS